jgi:putative tryptophan/tyrosine transport system substrate-binding protein
MASHIGRRKFLATLGGAAVAWPLAARAQPAMPVIGYLSLAGNPNLSNFPAGRAFLEGLAQAGYVPGRNLTIEFRLANFRGSILPQLAADLVAHKVAVIITSGSPYAAVAAKAATSTTPIVFMISEDPMEYGLVASFNRPGGNVTGVTFLTAEPMGSGSISSSNWSLKRPRSVTSVLLQANRSSRPG